MVFDVKRFDIYRKVPKDLTQPTLTGAIISIGCILFISFLFLSELYAFLSVEVVSELVVDDPEKVGRIDVSLNISLPFLDYVGVDIQDDMGRHEVGYVKDTVKTPYGEGGCNFQTVFQINKVPGNFHVSTHAAGAAQPPNPNMLHHIHSLTFGQNVATVTSEASFNSLRDRIAVQGEATHTHDYILKIVPSTYQPLGARNKMYAYQYTYAHRDYLAYSHHGAAMPAIWFRYDLSPITVRYTERRQPLYHFLTTVCAIVGGTFTVAGIVDSCLFSATEMYKKWEMGKLN